MKQFGFKILSILLVIIMLCSLTVPVQAANKSNITQIKENMITKIQLDGKGAKEKVKLTINDKKTSEYGYTSTVTLEINGKRIFKNSYKMEWGKPKVELIVTDINTSDKYKDLFLAVYDAEWCGTYQELIRVTYKNGKTTVDQLFKTLNSIKSPKISDKFYDMSGRGYLINSIESCKGLINGDLVVLGNGTVKWHVCLYTEIADYFHGYIKLTLKSGKLKAANYPSGTISEVGISGKLNKAITIYKNAGSSKKVVVVAKGKIIKFKEFKFVNKKLYVKVQYGKKIGWVSQSALRNLEWDGTLHA